MQLDRVQTKTGRIYIDKDTGARYVSVTRLLNKMYPFDDTHYKQWCEANGYDPKWILRESNRIGSKVHEWIENQFYGVDDMFDIEPRNEKEEGYKHAVGEILNDFQIVNSEFQVACDKYHYAGTGDAIVMRKNDGEMFLCDFKTWGAWKDEPSKRLDSKKVKKVAVQSSMYAHAMEWGSKTCVIVPFPDGTYMFKELKNMDEEWMTKIHDALDNFKEELNYGS